VILRGVFILCLALSTTLCGQSGFVSPLAGTPFLTGNYGEIRPNHFHAGLDFRTDIKEHLPIYAITDGYVSRIKVGTHGYGKVLYITHANGKVSVYGHQYSFNDSIKRYVQAAQDMLESFEVELFPKANELKVKQGEIVGFTGNTGDTEGPHLHFEIRDEKSEVPLNPLRFLKIMDTVAPVIKTIALYEEDFTTPLLVNLKDTTNDTLIVPIKLGIGIEAFDLEQVPGNKNNIYKAELYLDDSLFYRHVLDSIGFDQARFVNTYCDHSLKLEKKIKIQKCFVGKNNELPIYKTIANNGFLFLNDTLYHTLKIKVYDIYDHSAEAKLTLKRVPETKMKPLVTQPVNCLKSWDKSEKKYSIEMQEKTLYKDVKMVDTLHKGVLLFYAKDYSVPFHKSCMVSMKLSAAQIRCGDKLCITDGAGAYYGGNLVNDWLSFTTKNFGAYKIAMDTVAPKIKFVKPKSKKKKVYKNGELINFRVSDALSGIGAFKLYVNDRFTLSEYEHKTGLIFFEVSDKTPKGKVKVRLEVSDRKNNKATFETGFNIE